MEGMWIGSRFGVFPVFWVVGAKTSIGQARIYGKYEGTTLTSSHGAIMQDNLGETVDVLVVGELLCLSLPAIFLIVLP